jgi:hypothetical protein
MSEEETRSVSDLDSLSLYEVAVLAFTSPKEITQEDNIQSVVLTGKEAYLWAGALAYVLNERPELETDDLLTILRHAVTENIRHFREYYGMPFFLPFASEFVGRSLLISFIQQAGITFSPGEVISRLVSDVGHAIRSLEERGLIEDPFTTRMKGIALSILLLVPVNITSVTNDGRDMKFRMDSATWSYERTTDRNLTEREFKLKVNAILGLFKEQISPTIDEAMRNPPNQQNRERTPR